MKSVVGCVSVVLMLAFVVWLLSVSLGGASTALPGDSAALQRNTTYLEPLTNTTSVSNTTAPAIDSNLRELLKTANVTICAAVKDEDIYIDEWLQYHRYLGFDQVHIHDNAPNASAHLAALPEKYGDFVRVTHSPGLGLQVKLYSKCHTENATSNMWTAFMDVDEFIVLNQHPNIKSYLQDVAPDGGSVSLKWSIMGDSGALDYDPAPVVTRFTLTSKLPARMTKTIAYLPHVRSPHVHQCNMKPGYPRLDQRGRSVSDNTSPNDREVASMNHYQTKSWAEFQLKRRRGDVLYPRMMHVYNDSPEATEVIRINYVAINWNANEVEYTAARDFWLKNKAKEALVV